MIKMRNPITAAYRATSKIISELLGRTHTVYRRTITRYNAPRRDTSSPDYAYWDRARRAAVLGLEISGLLLKAVTNKIASWAFGKPPQIKAESPETTESLNKWMYTNHPDLLKAYKGSLDLGDSYFIINADLSVTLIPPDAITRIVAKEDFSVLLGYRITEKHPHPTERGIWQTIEDIYTAEQRTRTIWQNGVMMYTPQIYPNRIGGIIPIVHIPNNRSVGEYYGRPELQATVELLQQYGEVLASAIEGNIRMGRPTPNIDFKDIEALDDFMENNATSVSRTLPDGSTEKIDEVQFSSDDLVLSVGKMYYAQPGSFTSDTKILLSLLYFIFLEHAEVPEFVMGTAITGSKASAETQMPIFERFIWGKRTEARAWILQTLNIVQAYMVTLRQIPAIENVLIIWDALTGDDGKLTQATLEWALTEGLIDDATALSMASLEIDDIEDVIKKAREEATDKQEQQMSTDFQELFRRTVEEERARVAANGN